MDRWTQYLFESHPERTLREWARRLHFFRFFRAYGGHANDGDSLDVVFKYDNIEELHKFCKFIGITLISYSECPPQPEPGVSYPGDEFSKFPSLIPGTTWLKQPGHCEITGQKAFVWCEKGQIKISVGQAYVVVEADVVAAEEIEKALEEAPLERVEPPVDNRHCICPKYYPDYFA